MLLEDFSNYYYKYKFRFSKWQNDFFVNQVKELWCKPLAAVEKTRLIRLPPVPASKWVSKWIFFLGCVRVAPRKFYPNSCKDCLQFI